MKKDIKYCCRR